MTEIKKSNHVWNIGIFTIMTSYPIAGKKGVMCGEEPNSVMKVGILVHCK